MAAAPSFFPDPKDREERRCTQLCFNARKLDQESPIDGATIGGATPLWEWIGDGATVFRY